MRQTYGALVDLTIDRLHHLPLLLILSPSISLSPSYNASLPNLNIFYPNVG